MILQMKFGYPEPREKFYKQICSPKNPKKNIKGPLISYPEP